MSQADQNKALVRYWIEEVINNANLAVVDALCPPGYVGHNPHHPLRDTPAGPEEVKEHVVKSLRTAFPDLHQDIEDMLAEGDKVVVRSTFRGTHRGPFAGIAPTGRSLSMPAIEIFRVQDGTIPEHWISADYLGAMQQLGVWPAPATSSTAMG